MVVPLTRPTSSSSNVLFKRLMMGFSRTRLITTTTTSSCKKPKSVQHTITPKLRLSAAPKTCLVINLRHEIGSFTLHTNTLVFFGRGGESVPAFSFSFSFWALFFLHHIKCSKCEALAWDLALASWYTYITLSLPFSLSQEEERDREKEGSRLIVMCFFCALFRTFFSYIQGPATNCAMGL